MILSRADVGLVKYFLNLQVPEIQEKYIEIKDIARIAGFKTKVSLISHRPGIEPVGTVIGVRGSRIKTISEQINNEKIEVIEYTDDFSKYIINVCSPAEIAGYNLVEPTEPTGRRSVTLVCKPEKLALLIGKHGSNVKLISKMLNADIEVKTVHDMAEEDIPYQRVDMKSFRQRTFDNTFNKYQSNNDILSKFDN
ncbi:MAG: KH domain-containing protein [Mycoplasmoidaceae bacterium]|nr:KH domain-containing protein [Mycoplasmoidaceae bacterium]